MKVNRKEFLKALRAVEPGLSSKEVIEQSQCFVFSGGDIITYNDEIAVRAASPLEIEDTAVVASPLLKLLDKMDDEEVDVALISGEIQVKGKRKRGGVKVEAEVLLPVDGIEKPGKFRKLPDTFATSLSTVVGSCGKDESKFILTCVHITKEYVEACDNYQVTRYHQPLKVKGDFLLPAASVRQLLKYKIDQACFSETWAHFRNEETGVSFSCRSYVDEYPNLDPILALEEASVVKLPKNMAEAVTRAEVFSNETMESDNQVRVKLGDNKLVLRGEGDSGWYEESRKVAFADEEISFAIDPFLLRDISQRASEVEVGSGKLRIDLEDYVHIACLIVQEQ